MRVSVAIISWLLVLAPCVRPSQCASTKLTRSCCSTVTRCGCHGGERPAPAREPVTPSAKAALEQPADFAATQVGSGTPGPIAGASNPSALPAAEEAAPIYLSACTFRC
jgi:hypothetical protein